MVALDHQGALRGFRDLEARAGRTIDVDVFLHQLTVEEDADEARLGFGL
jgi:hypothetical protein